MANDRKILLVDDSATTLMMEKMVLRGQPYDLLVARNGQEAIEKVADQAPDLIVLDAAMPGMSGIEVCRRLRTSGNAKQTPVIMVTGRGEPDQVDASYESGCTDHVTKPISGLELLTKIRDHLGG